MKLERVVVGTDFSESAASMATWVANHLAPEAHISLVHAVHVTRPPGFLRRHARPPEDVLAEAEIAATTRMAELARAFAPARTATIVRRGEPFEVLGAVAADERANLLVVASRGERQMNSRLPGTTADRLARTAPVPLLVYRGVPRLVPRRVLAAVDDCDEAPDVMRMACTICDPVEGEVRLLHVLGTAAYSHALSMSAIGARDEDETQDRMRDELRLVAQHWLDELARSVASPPRVCAEVLYGDAAAGILADASRWSAEVIVLGRRGSGGVLRGLLGGTVRRVLHDEQHSVLVIPPAAG